MSFRPGAGPAAGTHVNYRVGAEVVNSQPDDMHRSTQMGSGHFLEEGFSKASYFKNIQMVGNTNNLKARRGLGTFTEQSNCYDVQNDNNMQKALRAAAGGRRVRSGAAGARAGAGGAAAGGAT